MIVRSTSITESQAELKARGLTQVLDDFMKGTTGTGFLCGFQSLSVSGSLGSNPLGTQLQQLGLLFSLPIVDMDAPGKSFTVS